VHRGESPRHAVISVAAGLLCGAAGLAVATAAYAWSALCRDGTFERCLDGYPSFDLVFQVVLAAAGLAATLVMRSFVKHRHYRLAAAALAVAVLLFATWAVFLDAATHGWDDLKLLWLG
jgi:hypothetical protein